MAKAKEEKEKSKDLDPCENSEKNTAETEAKIQEAAQRALVPRKQPGLSTIWGMRCHLCEPKKEEEEEKDLDMVDSDGEADEIERPWWYAYLDIETKEQICEYCRSYFLVWNCGT